MFTKYLIYFGWDITTKEFIEIFKQSDVYNKIVTFDYDYDLITLLVTITQ